MPSEPNSLPRSYSEGLGIRRDLSFQDRVAIYGALKSRDLEYMTVKNDEETNEVILVVVANKTLQYLLLSGENLKSVLREAGSESIILQCLIR